MEVLEAIGTTLAAEKAGRRILKAIMRAYADWKRGRTKRLAMAIDPHGRIELLTEDEGVLVGNIGNELDVEPIVLSGSFIADKSFADFVEDVLEYEDKLVLLFICDEETGEVLLATFDFEGYSIELWPGLYSLYAYIFDPEEDDVLALGFPNWGDLQDPNPIGLEGSGDFPLDFVLFEVNDDSDDEDLDDEGDEDDEDLDDEDD